MRDVQYVDLASDDFWFKVTGMLQQNWAVIDPTGTGCRVRFVYQTSAVFDEISFEDGVAAARALAHNGYRRYADDPRAHEFIAPPEPPYVDRTPEDVESRVYSSGRYWRPLR